jgi:hypothetical protein
MLQPRDPVALQRHVFLAAKLLQHPVCGQREERLLQLVEQLVFLLRAVFHPGEADRLGHQDAPA